MVPGYKKIKNISQGPLTSVILCRQESLDRDVLLKILHPQHAQDKEIVERFIREAKMYARLKHDNIVNVIDLGRQNDSYFIAMEFVDGYSLEEFIKKYSPIPLRIAVYIIEKVLTGLQFAHNSGIIHRDIKPSNILIGKNGEVKITDFGLARPLNLSAITEQGNILGTPSYMAPELAKSEPATVSSDIFALGATFYELLINENVFLGTSVADTINKIINRKPVPIHKQREDVPEWLSILIVKMLEKKTNHRPENCSLILNEIKRNTKNILKDEFLSFINNKSAHQPFDGIGEKSLRKKNKLSLFYTAAAILLTAVIVYYFTYYFNNDYQKNELEKKNNLAVKNTFNTDTIKSKIENEEITEKDKIEIKSIKPERIISVKDNMISENKTKSSTIPLPENIILNGKLYINVMPWANVLVNEKKIDTTPLSKPIELAPGIYDVELRNPSYLIYKKKIKIEEGKNDSIIVRLQQAFGNLKLTVVPWGKIYINDKYIDTTPITEPIKIKSGQNELNVVNPNYPNYTELIEIKAGETQEKTIYLKN